jgi:branched-chain amino acid transport system permease protein
MKRNETLILVAILLAGLITPFFVQSRVWMTVLHVFFYYALLALSWNMVFGYAGQFSFAHVTFSAIGGYTSALAAIHLAIFPILGIILGGLFSALIGILLGILVLRLRGFYLCLVTWAFAEVTNIVIITEYRVTAGTGGLLAPSLFLGPKGALYSYYLGLGLLILILGVSAVLRNSRIGLFLFAIRDDQDAAEIMGIKTVFWKVFAFSFSGFWAGMAGAYYAHFFGLIDPSIGGLDEMGKVILMVVVGGIGSLYGPLLGAFFVVISSEIIRGSLAEMSILIFAMVMILTMRFARGGFMQIIDVLFSSLKTRPAGTFERTSADRPS